MIDRRPPTPFAVNALFCCTAVRLMRAYLGFAIVLGFVELAFAARWHGTISASVPSLLWYWVVPTIGLLALRARAVDAWVAADSGSGSPSEVLGGEKG